MNICDGDRAGGDYKIFDLDFVDKYDDNQSSMPFKLLWIAVKITIFALCNPDMSILIYLLDIWSLKDSEINPNSFLLKIN